jgi:GTP-binding protein HflX
MPSLTVRLLIPILSAFRAVDELIGALQEELGSWRLRSRFRVPVAESSLIAEIHRVGHVLELRYEGDAALIVAHVPTKLEQRLAPFSLNGHEGNES